MWRVSGNMVSIMFFKLYLWWLNNDFILDVVDVVLLVNIILGEISIDLSADLNLDNLVDILDVVHLINIILNWNFTKSWNTTFYFLYNCFKNN